MTTITVRNNHRQPQFVFTDAGPLKAVMVGSRSTAVVEGTKLLNPITKTAMTEEDAKRLGLSVVNTVKEPTKKK